MNKVAQFFKYYLDRFVWFKSDKYSIQELLFYYTLLITILITGLSLITNPILGVPFSATIFSLFSVLFIPYVFWLAYYRQKLILAKNIYLVFFVLMINGIWLTSGGSSGTALIMVQGFLLFYLFYSNEKYYQWVLFLVFVDILGLFAIEYFMPSFIIPYQSPENRLLDVLLITFIFFVFELPVIIYAKKSILRDKQAAMRSEAAKTSFVVNLSHEIRTPMNAILGFTELLEDNTLDDEFRQDYIRIINQNGRNLLNLLNNVISFSKIESNQNTVSAARLSLNSLFNQVYVSLGQQIRENSQVNFCMSLPASDVSICTDSLMVYQILNNLAFNALKFTEKGFVEMGYQQDGDGVVLYVKDSGIGISDDAQEKIFERFSQAGGTLKAHAQHGAGLGLAICKGLTILLNGQIWVESKQGKGSTFYVRLPIQYSSN